VTRAFAAFAFAILVPMAAAAQTTADPSIADDQAAGARPATSQGPMIIEQIHNGFLGAPEAKVTQFDNRAEGMIGGSAGWVFEEAMFVGGGGYWMVQSGHSDRELAYGGVVLQWFVHNGSRFGWSARVLAGGGEATLPGTVTQIIYPPVPDPRIVPPRPIPPPQLRTVNIRVREGFVVAEPEVNARIGLSKHVRLTIGAGYRVTGSDRRFRDGFDGDGFDRTNRINGATGTLGIQIGG